MFKLTKRQWKDRERILAWLNDEEFRENSRSKPAVPELTVEDVLEQYVPPDVIGAGQYFTPISMARLLVGYLSIYWGEGYSVLDPCAGVGHLLYPLVDTGVRLVAYEIEEECVRIGRKLFLDIEWHWDIPFDHLEDIEGQFSCVVINPPFGTRRGMAPGDEMCEGRCSLSEHIFFELAVRACVPGGQIGVIAPYNFIQKFPRAFREWCDVNVRLECELGQLPGEFAWSGIKVHGYVFRRLDPLARIYERAAERQHAPGGVMTQVQEKWAELNKPVVEQLSLW